MKEYVLPKGWNPIEMPWDATNVNVNIIFPSGFIYYSLGVHHSSYKGDGVGWAYIKPLKTRHKNTDVSI
jgi:hypothetical protein